MEPERATGGGKQLLLFLLPLASCRLSRLKLVAVFLKVYVKQVQNGNLLNSLVSRSFFSRIRNATSISA